METSPCGGKKISLLIPLNNKSSYLPLRVLPCRHYKNNIFTHTVVLGPTKESYKLAQLPWDTKPYWCPQCLVKYISPHKHLIGRFWMVGFTLHFSVLFCFNFHNFQTLRNSLSWYCICCFCSVVVFPRSHGSKLKIKMDIVKICHVLWGCVMHYKMQVKPSSLLLPIASDPFHLRSTFSKLWVHYIHIYDSQKGENFKYLDFVKWNKPHTAIQAWDDIMYMWNQS